MPKNLNQDDAGFISPLKKDEVRPGNMTHGRHAMVLYSLTVLDMKTLVDCFFQECFVSFMTKFSEARHT